MRLLVPSISVAILLIFLLRWFNPTPDKLLRSSSYVAIYFITGVILETEILILLQVQIFSTMTDSLLPTKTSAWEKLLPPGGDQSAAVRYHLFWDRMAIRKIHEATDEEGTFDILIHPVPIPPAVYTPEQLDLLAAANLPRPVIPEAPAPGAPQAQLSLYTASVANYKLHYDLYFKIKSHFQTITPAHLLALESDIKSPLTFASSNAYDVHVAKHVHLNRGLVAAARTRTQMDMTSDLRTSLMTSQHAALFAMFLSIYDTTHLTLESQSFDDMQRICSAAIPALLTSLAATSGSLSQFGANGARDKSQPKKDAKPKKPPSNRPAAYCWTHGNTYHASSDCRNKATGHQDRATASNKMGGKDA